MSLFYVAVFGDLTDPMVPTLRGASGDVVTAYLFGTFSSCQHGANSHFPRFFSTFSPMHQNVVTLGGVCVCFSKSVRKGHFRNVWVGGGGGRWSRFCAQSCTRQWPLQWTESGVPCGSRQVAVSRLYGVSWPAWQDAESHTPTLHPQNAPFCAPKVPGVHQANLQHVVSTACKPGCSK